MGRLAVYRNGAAVGVGGAVSPAQGNPALLVRPYVDAQAAVRHLVEQARLNHLPAAAVLLGGLEHQPDASGPGLLHLVEDGPHRQQVGGVDVVPAGVHHAGLFALKGQAGLLLDGQRVHIPSEEEELAGLSTVNGGDQAGLDGALHIGNAQAGQLPGDQCAGLKLLIGQLRVFMNPAAELDRVIRPAVYRFKQLLNTIHCGSPPSIISSFYSSVQKQSSFFCPPLRGTKESELMYQQ